jgi:hypothetical protein
MNIEVKYLPLPEYHITENISGIFQRSYNYEEN